MSIKLEPTHKRKKRKIVGRGMGSTRGKTCTRGDKGQKARKGKTLPYVGFEGGQTPIYRLLPKRGFVNPCRKDVDIVNLDQLNELKSNPEKIDIAFLVEHGLIKRRHGIVKILGFGELDKKLVIEANLISQGALKKLEQLGGTFIPC